MLIRNLQSLPIDEQLLERAATEAARVGTQAADSPAPGLPDAISIAIVDDRRIRELNRRFRGTDATTDVIAFEADDEPDRRSGELIVSADTARRQAREYDHSFERELCLLVAHGVLHVLGYEDYEDEARARMLALGEDVLEQMKGGSSGLG
ncbi:MAG: rRNA maturation RNase YbeY [Armatimonadota bacterium]